MGGTISPISHTVKSGWVALNLQWLCLCSRIQRMSGKRQIWTLPPPQHPQTNSSQLFYYESEIQTKRIWNFSESKAFLWMVAYWGIFGSLTLIFLILWQHPRKKTIPFGGNINSEFHLTTVEVSFGLIQR